MLVLSTLLALATAAAATVDCASTPGLLSNFGKFNMTAFVTDGHGNVSASYPLTTLSWGLVDPSGGPDVLATADTFTWEQPGLFILQNNSIAILAADNETPVEWTEDIAGPSSYLPFNSSAITPSPSGGIYCAAASTSPHGTGLPWSVLLALGSLTNNFWLCEASNFPQMKVVVYDYQQGSASGAKGLNYDSCFGVWIGLAPSSGPNSDQANPQSGIAYVQPTVSSSGPLCVSASLSFWFSAALFRSRLHCTTVHASALFTTRSNPPNQFESRTHHPPIRPFTTIMSSYNYAIPSTSNGLSFFPAGPAAPHAFSTMHQSPAEQHAMYAAFAQSTKTSSSSGKKKNSK
ncbi:hypothetical protein K488DRAFT_83347 [Vararia minispora EC-137]|uniref:Uncharacterized protein n=1 Tax=Vararia minispora EC-137 TaxID=1314806 RepID=A0ACB8QTH3_9AGAM|nr:hypothetical protein K488DRAFT_83347 [Vararia minispora EC-137]